MLLHRAWRNQIPKDTAGEREGRVKVWREAGDALTLEQIIITWGIWVVFPLPVSPTTMQQSFFLISWIIAFLAGNIGRLVLADSRGSPAAAAIVMIGTWLKSCVPIGYTLGAKLEEKMSRGCPICTERLEEDLASSPCGHVFHHTWCVSTWSKMVWRLLQIIPVNN